MTDIYLGYAIAHLMREFGFHKESPYYIIKAKGQEPIMFQINEFDHWNFAHYDFNKVERFFPHMGKSWECNGFTAWPLYQPYEYEGNIYTFPTIYQVHEFCKRLGFCCSYVREPKEILRYLVFVYRTLRKDDTAFRKYREKLR